ncbi:MAG: 4-(cytidine 5'-diphospho)-2-C-methyl-D-erythritol kinase, partial [Enterococcus hulanensis]
MEIMEKAPAKINLGLDILGKRPDGLHELAMVMASIDLADRLYLEEIPENKIL